MTAILIFSNPKDMWPVFRNITGLHLGRLEINLQFKMSGARYCLLDKRCLIIAEISGQMPLEIQHDITGAEVKIVHGSVEENYAKFNTVCPPDEPTLFLVQSAAMAA